MKLSKVQLFVLRDLRRTLSTLKHFPGPPEQFWLDDAYHSMRAYDITPTARALLRLGMIEPSKYDAADRSTTYTLTAAGRAAAEQEQEARG